MVKLTPRRATLQWCPILTEATGSYLLQYNPVRNPAASTQLHLSGDSSSVELTSLIPDTTYKAVLHPKSTQRMFQAVSVTFSTPPGKRTLCFTACVSKQVLLLWFCCSPSRSISCCRVFEPRCGVCVRLRPSSHPCGMGSSAGSTSAAIHGGVRCHSEWMRQHCHLVLSSELYLSDRAGTGHSVPGDSQRSVCRWEKKNHVCEGVHRRRYVGLEKFWFWQSTF